MEKISSQEEYDRNANYGVIEYTVHKRPKLCQLIRHNIVIIVHKIVRCQILWRKLLGNTYFLDC